MAKEKRNREEFYKVIRENTPENVIQDKECDVFIPNDLGFQQETVKTIVEQIFAKLGVSDVKIITESESDEEDDSDRDYPNGGCLIVPLKNPNSHNYKIGVPILCKSKGETNFLDVNGKFGNNMSISMRSSYRFATDDEIKKFAKTFEGKIDLGVVTKSFSF
jgi:hypothetical protein